MNRHLTSNFVSLNQKQLCPIGAPFALMALFFSCEHMKYSAEQGYFCVMYTEHVSQKNCWSFLVLQCHIIMHIYIYIYIYIYIWMKNLFRTVFWWMEKEQEDITVVEMKFAWNMLNLKPALSNHSSSLSAQYNMSDSSFYTATNLFNIVVYNTSIIVMQSCETLLCAVLVVIHEKLLTLCTKLLHITVYATGITFIQNLRCSTQHPNSCTWNSF